MASLRLDPPTSFPFSRPDEWPHWKRRFEQFRLASGLSAEGDTRQISTLLYCMGDEAEDTLISTNISEEHRKDYSRVIAAFDMFFKVRKNIIFERARFNGRSQREGESVEQFITSLYNLAENCEYGELKGISYFPRTEIRTFLFPEEISLSLIIRLFGEEIKRFLLQTAFHTTVSSWGSAIEHYQNNYN